MKRLRRLDIQLSDIINSKLLFNLRASTSKNRIQTLKIINQKRQKKIKIFDKKDILDQSIHKIHKNKEEYLCCMNHSLRMMNRLIDK